jgi:hypothetical protein
MLSLPEGQLNYPGSMKFIGSDLSALRAKFA